MKKKIINLNMSTSIISVLGLSEILLKYKRFKNFNKVYSKNVYNVNFN